MSIIIKVRAWLAVHHQAQQRLWFIMLWSAGLLSALLLAYPIKLLIKSIS